MAGVSTAMDGQVQLLERSPTVKVRDAAKDLDVSRERIEGWAKMLEKSKVLEVHYSVIGGAILKRGPEFDSVATGKKKVPAAEAIKALAAKAPGKKGAERPIIGIKGKTDDAEVEGERPNPVEPPGKQEYLLIQRLEQEEAAVRGDIVRLQEEEAQVMECMKGLIDEGKTIAQHIEALTKTVESLAGKKGRRKAS